MKHSFLKRYDKYLMPDMLAIYKFFAEICWVWILKCPNCQKLEKCRTFKCSVIQLISENSSDTPLCSIAQAILCSTAHNRQDVNFSRNNPFFKICNDDETRNNSPTSRIELHDVSDFIMLTFDRRHFGKNILLIYMYLILRILSEMNIS